MVLSKGPTVSITNENLIKGELDSDRLVSIITPSHNSAKFIAETIDSVIAQTYSTWEMIIVDDCSIDDTRLIVASYAARDERIRLIVLERNGGAAVARNTAIKAARGRWIAFVDSDDLWTADKLEKQIAFMRASDCAFSFASYERMDEDGCYVSTVRVPNRISYSQLLKNNVIACLTAVYDTSKLGKILMPDIRKGQDYGLWLMLLKLTGEAMGMCEVLGCYRLRRSSISSNKLESSTWVWRIYRDIMQFNLPKTLYYFGWYAVTGIMRRLQERLRGKA